MLNWRWLAIAGVMVIGLAASFVYAQERGGMGGMRGGGMGQAGQRSPEEIVKMREQMMNNALQRIGLSENEQTAVKRVTRAKEEARGKLSEALQKLNSTAFRPGISAKEAELAIAAYRERLAEYRRKIQAQDEALSGKLSAVSRARCLAMGILENGVGGRAPMRGGGGMGGGGMRGGMGGGMRGGMGGGMGGGQAPR